MGSEFSKGKSSKDAAKYGQVFLQTDKVAYYGGETVTGKIYLNLFLPYPGKQLLLKLKGKEAVHFVIQRSETITEEINGERISRTINYDDLFEEKDDIIKILVPIHSWGTIMPGQFIIPFAFVLPANLPSSFHQEGHRFLANITYRLEAILEPDHKHQPKLKYKQNFVVRTPITNAAQGQSNEIRTEITTCCCCSQGSNVLKVNFEKNWYAPGEIAQVAVQLDNTQSKVNNTRIRFCLEQRLSLSAAGRGFTRVFNKAERDLDGIPAGNSSNSNFIALNLPSFQGGDYQKVKTYSMTQYLIGLQDNNTVLNSATKSKYISSEYFLQVSCPMDGCCANTPSSARPIQIYYPEFQQVQVYAPENWNPQQYESVNVSFGGQGVQMAVNVTDQYGQNTGMNAGTMNVGMNMGVGMNVGAGPGPQVQYTQNYGQAGAQGGQGQYTDTYNTTQYTDNFGGQNMGAQVQVQGQGQGQYTDNYYK